MISFAQDFKNAAARVTKDLRHRGLICHCRRKRRIDPILDGGIGVTELYRHVLQCAIHNMIQIHRLNVEAFPAGLRFGVRHHLLHHAGEAPGFLLDDRRVLFNTFAIVNNTRTEVMSGRLNDSERRSKLVRDDRQEVVLGVVRTLGFGPRRLRLAIEPSVVERETGAERQVLEQRQVVRRWSIHAFESVVHNLISYDAVAFAPENTDEARTRGVEFDGGFKAGAWSGDLTATWLDPRDRAVGSPNYNNLLPRRARGTGRLEVARTWGAFRVAGRLNVAGPRFDDLANTESLGGYTTLDTLIEWTPAKQWVLQGKIGNATDRRYETALFYPQDGRNFLVTLRYRPTGA